MSRNKSNNWCKGRIFWISWGKIYLVTKRKLHKETLYVMLFGASGPPIMSATLIPKWRMNLSYLRKRSNKDLKIGRCLNHLQCLDLELISIRNYIKNTMGISKILARFTDKRTIRRNGSNRVMMPIPFPWPKGRRPKRWETKANQ